MSQAGTRPAQTAQPQSSLVPGLPSDLVAIRLLGRGSTADVFLAREPGLKRLVAIKVLRGESASNPTTRRRFQREAQSAARVTHPNITGIYRIGELSGDVPYIVMEYVDGRTVRDVIDASGRFELAEATTLLASIASALAAVHGCGIVHRDVQPGNVYIENRSGRAVVGDFGLAALLESGATATELTVAGVRLGDLRYMSPERLKGERATERSDIYSFGVMAYEMLTGRGPYEATAGLEQASAHLHSEPTPLKTLRPELDAGIAQLIEHCLAKDPNRRPRARAHPAPLRADGPAVAASSAADRGAIPEFFAELRRRRVYRVLVGYGAFAVAMLGATQVLYEAFDISQRSFRIVVVATLAGLPLAIVLAWIFDITATGIKRTDSPGVTARFRFITWFGLGASTLAVIIIGYLLLR